jgi:PBP1b-binding outer membrane lipoprotein LpoB
VSAKKQNYLDESESSMKNLLLISLLALAISGCASMNDKPAQVDRISPEEMAKILPPPVATLTLEEIVAASKANKTPDEIIAKIKASNSRYELSPTQTLDLNKKGVDTKVLDYMHQSNESAKQNALADALNAREKEKRTAQKQLQYERAIRNSEYYDYFYNPYYGYGPYWNNHFYWGPGYNRFYRRH